VISLNATDRHGQLAGVVIAHIGHFDPGYSRNASVARALRGAGAQVLTITDERPFLQRAPGLLRHVSHVGAHAVVVGFPGSFDVALARLVMARGRGPVILDALVGGYETAIEDRQRTTARTWRARRYRIKDHIVLRLANVVLVDTDAHGTFFAEEFGVDPARIRTFRLGTDETLMRPRATPANKTFTAVFYGTYIPLQGVEHIVRAAHILERRDTPVRFVLVGRGQTHQAVRSLAEELDVHSIEFMGRLPPAELAEVLGGGDVCLGVFGTSAKARRVVPNKVVDGLAMARPVVTADTPAVRELLAHGRDAWLVPTGDPTAIAEALTTLAADCVLCARLAEAGRRTFLQQLSSDALVAAIGPIVCDAIRP